MFTKKTRKIIMSVDSIIAPDFKPNLNLVAEIKRYWSNDEVEVIFVSRLPELMRSYLVELLKDFDGLYHGLVLYSDPNIRESYTLFTWLNQRGYYTGVYCNDKLEEDFYDRQWRSNGYRYDETEWGV